MRPGGVGDVRLLTYQPLFSPVEQAVAITMSGPQTFELVISVLGAVAGVFFAVATVLRDSTATPRAACMALASLCLALSFADDAAAAAAVFDAAPALFGLAQLALPFLGPLIWLHVSAHANPAGAGWTRARPHVLAAGGLIVLALPWVSSGGRRWSINTGAELAPGDEGAVLSLLAFLAATAVQQFVYLVWAVMRARGVGDPTARRWFRGCLSAAAIAWVAWAASLAALVAGFDDALATAVLNLALAACLYGVALFAIASPPDPLTVGPSAGRPKYAKSALTPADAGRLMNKLESAVREGVHRDPGLTLRSLSRRIGAAANDLSQTLNICAGGYREWLARARVADAMSRLRRGEATELLDAAYAAGFNSKSTFYEAFRRVAGSTPAAWRAAGMPEPGQGLMSGVSGRDGSDDGPALTTASVGP